MTKATSRVISVPKWLVLGAFPLEEREPGTWVSQGHASEAHFAPEAGEKFCGRTWCEGGDERGLVQGHN